MKKYYAVARGRQSGIYGQWSGENGAQSQVNGYANARFKSFSSLEEASAWYRDQTNTEPLLFGISSNRQPAGRQAAGHKLLASSSSAATTFSEDTVLIYTDGASLGNPGPGGYGVVLLTKKNRRELSGGYRRTTNNRMELTACIRALRALKKPSRAVLHSDSRYVINAVTKGWAQRWRSKGWMRSATEPAENSDLWADLLDLLDRHEVEFRWVRGHAGTKENERCDQLAVQAAKMKDLPADEGYESQRPRRVSPPDHRKQLD